MKLIDYIFFAFQKTSAGSVNPALKRLEKLSCVEFTSKMSDGGMLSKIYSITPSGKKHLTDLLLTYTVSNPSHILNDAKILLHCCDFLSVNELIEFKSNLQNNLELYAVKLQQGLEDDYTYSTAIQKKVIEITLKETKELIELL